MRQQSGHVHLGDAELGGDLRLGQVAEEAQRDDLLFAWGQLGDQRPERFPVFHVLHVRVEVAEQVTQLGGGLLTLGVLQARLVVGLATPAAKLVAFRSAACYLSTVFLLGLVALAFLPETKGRAMPED